MENVHTPTPDVKVSGGEIKIAQPTDPETGACLPMILQNGNRHWYLKPDGTYSRTVKASVDFYRGLAAHRHLKWAIKAGFVELEKIDPRSGKSITKSRKDLLEEYGCYAENVISSIAAEANTYDFLQDILTERA